MKRLAAVTLIAMMATFFSPIVPTAQAASLEDALNQMLVQNSSTSAHIQELLKLKQNLEQNKKSAIVEDLARQVLSQAGNANIPNIIANGNAGDAVKAAVRQEVEKRINDRLAPYQKELGILTTLFGGSNALNPNVARDNNSLTGAPQNYKRALDMTATAYGPGPLDNGKWNNQTFMGGIVRKGVAAVDPRVIPMGTKLWIEGYGEAIAEDQGSAIKGNRIDLAFNSRQEALDYGIQHPKVYVLN